MRRRSRRYDHLPVLTLALSQPTTARVTYVVSPTGVGPTIGEQGEQGVSARVRAAHAPARRTPCMHAARPKPLVERFSPTVAGASTLALTHACQVVAAAAPGALADDAAALLCAADGGGAEQAERAAELFDGALIFVREGGCSLAAKATTAQQYGATGLLVAPGAPGADGSAADAAGVAEVPVVRVAAADAADLALWLRDYNVEARLRSSEPLAANDPSLTAAQRAVAPDGFHPAWSSLGDSGRGECGVPFAQRFHMPGGGNGNFWYAYAYGTVLMVHMSTEHDFTPGSPQHTWLNRTLAAVDREATAWVVVAMHRPIYSRTMGRGDQNTSALLQRSLEPLFRAHAVDVVLAGHEASAAPPPAPPRRDAPPGPERP